MVSRSRAWSIAVAAAGTLLAVEAGACGVSAPAGDGGAADGDEVPGDVVPPADTVGNPCTTSAECDDGEGCNGVETCDDATRLCLGGIPESDFTRCRTADGHVASCVNGRCDLDYEEICIPAGPFVMGVDYEDAPPGSWHSGVNFPEWPKHIVTVSEYCIDKFEITNRRYRRCMDAGRCPVPRGEDWACGEPYGTPYLYSAYYLDYPMIWIGFDQTRQLCAFEGGKRLPTEAEWEKAARGGCELGSDPAACDEGDERIWPWGNEEPTPAFAQYLSSGAGYAPVGSHPLGASAYGVMDLAGNVEEWTLDCDGISRDGGSWEEGTQAYVACTAGCTDPLGTCPRHIEVVTRGGFGCGWAGMVGTAWDIRATVRTHHGIIGRASGEYAWGAGYSGGRCVRSAVPQNPPVPEPTEEVTP